MTELNKAPGDPETSSNESPVTMMEIDNEPPSLGRSQVCVLPEKLSPPSLQSHSKQHGAKTKKSGPIVKKATSAKPTKRVAALSLESLSYLPPLNSNIPARNGAETSVPAGPWGSRPRRRAQRRNSFVIHRKRNGAVLPSPFGLEDIVMDSGSREVASSLDALKTALMAPPPQAPLKEPAQAPKTAELDLAQETDPPTKSIPNDLLAGTPE